jgi:hypothetical protein
LTKQLAPILVRANVPNKMREIRSAIAELESIWEEYPNQATPAHAVKLQKLRHALEKLKREYIFVISE